MFIAIVSIALGNRIDDGHDLDHRFVIHGQQLLAYDLSEGMKSGAGTPGVDDAFHLGKVLEIKNDEPPDDKSGNSRWR